MPYKTVESLSLTPSNEDRLLFEIAWQGERIRNLEHIVYELLRDRIDPEIADGWIKTSQGRGFTPHLNQLKDRGKRVAEFLDQWPAEEFPSSRWPAKPDLKTPK